MVTVNPGWTKVCSASFSVLVSPDDEDDDDDDYEDDDDYDDDDDGDHDDGGDGDHDWCKFQDDEDDMSSCWIIIINNMISITFVITLGFSGCWYSDVDNDNIEEAQEKYNDDEDKNDVVAGVLIQPQQGLNNRR